MWTYYYTGKNIANVIMFKVLFTQFVWGVIQTLRFCLFVHVVIWSVIKKKRKKEKKKKSRSRVTQGLFYIGRATYYVIIRSDNIYNIEVHRWSISNYITLHSSLMQNQNEVNFWINLRLLMCMSSTFWCHTKRMLESQNAPLISNISWEKVPISVIQINTVNKLPICM